MTRPKRNVLAPGCWHTRSPITPRPGEESRHNLAYWRYLDYAGIGPGAHGRVTVGGSLHATRRHRAPEVWAERVERTGDGLTSDEPVPPRSGHGRRC